LFLFKNLAVAVNDIYTDD